ncbi:MAG: hypothetical protein QOG16_1280 [Actinomycetota bacterium]|nr:hypothetical protein [Actinomycetota bacterium]
MRFGQRLGLIVAASVLVGTVATTNAGSTGKLPVSVAQQSASPSSSGSPTSSPSSSPRPTSGGATSGPRWLRSACNLPPEQLRRTLRGYYERRSPELTFIPTEPNFFGNFLTTTTHSGPWPYVQRVPLVLYGPGFIRNQGETRVDREVTVADLAPTFAELLRTPFPDNRPGRVLQTALLPRAERNGKPRLILTVVWDGGGWNTLQHWPGAWPHLKEVMDNGTSIAGATAGSNPSVTPAIHANMGTGTFPAAHGIVSIPQRRGSSIVDSWSGHSPANLLVETLADLYDPRTNNRAKVGLVAEHDWHLGMIGHGAMLSKGDKDIAVLTGSKPFETNSRYYRLPSYMQHVPGFQADVETMDRSDGRNNGKWLGHDLPEDHDVGYATPAWTMYQTRLLRKVLNEEGFGKDRTPDLFYTNFKQIDEISHAYFLQSKEMQYSIPYSDKALGELIRWMNSNVGEKRYVLAFTADHGVGPQFTKIGAWAIDMDELIVDVAIHFRVRVTDLFQNQRPQGFWLNMSTMRREGITLGEMADFLLDYTIRDNVRDGQHVRPQYQDRMDERLFDAAFPSNKVTQMSDCKGA